MRLQLPPLSPVVGFVMVIHIAEQQAALCLVDDEPDVAARPHRPEVLVLCLVELVEAHSWTRGIYLQVKSRGLDGFLFVTCQAREAVSEGVGDSEVHETSVKVE